MKKSTENDSPKQKPLQKIECPRNSQSEDEQISQYREEEIRINNSPGKKGFKKDTAKLKIEIESYQQRGSYESEILDEHEHSPQHNVNQKVLTAKKQLMRPLTLQQNNKETSDRKKNLQPETYRFTINRLSKINIQQQKPLKNSSYTNSDYNQTFEERALSRKVLSDHLKNIGCWAGDYVEIKLAELHGFSPVYKVINFKTEGSLLGKERKVSDDIVPDSNSVMKNNSVSLNPLSSKLGRRKSLSVALKSPEIPLQLTLGSKIFLKHEKFNHLTAFHVNKLFKLPCMNIIYTYIYIKGKGYLVCNDKTSQIQIQEENYEQELPSIEFDEFEDGEKVQGIWKCVLAEGSKKNQQDHIAEEQISEIEEQEKYIVKFVNFLTGRCLSMDHNGQFQADDFNEKGSRFKLRKKSHPNEEKNVFTLQKVPEMRRDYESNLIRQHVPYQEGKRTSEYPLSRSSQYQIELIECQESVITLQQQLLYIKSKLSSSPSLKLIEVVLETMTPYLIPEFMHSIFIVSEYIQKVFYDLKISHLIFQFLLENVEACQESRPREGLESIRETDQRGEGSERGSKRTNSLPSPYKIKPTHDKLSKNYSLGEQSKSNSFLKIIKYLNRLCLNSKQNSEVFLPLIDLFFSQPLNYFNEVIALVSNNIHFISQFYKREWYQRIIRAILMHKTEHRQEQQGYQPYFMILEKFCSLGKSPHVENQFLIFHTIKQPQFEAKNILLNLYVEGQYIFIRQSNKDIELMTFLESKQPENRISLPSSILNNRNSQEQGILKHLNHNSHSMMEQQRNSNRFSLLQKSSTFLLLLYKVVLYLQVLQMLGFGYNYSILKKYKLIIDKLLSYCNKHKPLVIKDYDFTRWVLKCAYCFYQPEPASLSIFPKCRLGIVDNPSGQAKFKQKVFSNQVFPLILAGLGYAKADKYTPRVSQKQAIQLCNIFLNKCKQYYILIKSKKIKISDIFQTKAVYGEPIEEYFDFLKLIFSNRLLKMKQKKKAQFMQYIQKLFQNVFPQNERIEQNEESVLITFLKFLLRIISFDEKYENYLEKLRLTANYHENILANQLIKNKKSTVKRIKILNPDQECSKIMKIRFINTFFEKNQLKKSPTQNEFDQVRKSQRDNKHELDRKDAPELFKAFQSNKQKKQVLKNEGNDYLKNTNQTNKNLAKSQRLNEYTLKPLNNLPIIPTYENGDTTDLLEEFQASEKYLSLKRKSLELLILMLINVNEEFIEESIQTLNYFIKNPTILNLSAFQLLSSVPKYENQFGIRRRVLEQWYLVSDPETFELLTTVLRLLHRKVCIHINKISNVQVITDSNLSQIAIFIANNSREIEKMSKSINSWFKEQLFTQSSQSFSYFDEKLQNVAESINTTKQLKDCGCASVPFQIKKIIVNLSSFDWIKRTLAHIAREQKRLKSISSQNLGYNKTRLNSLKTYSKVMRSYTEKICFILAFLIEPIDFSRMKLQETGCFQVEYETTLQYMQAVLCLLGQNLSEIADARWILVKILQIAKTHYDVNLCRFFSQLMCKNLFQCRQSAFKVFSIFANLKQYETVLVSINFYTIFQSFNQKDMEQLIKMLAGGYSKEKDQIRNEQNILSLQDKNHENVWFYFIYRLNYIRKKHELESTQIPLLKTFFQKILLLILQNEKNSQMVEEHNLRAKSGHHASKISGKQIRKLFTQVQRRRYIAYFIAEYVQSQVQMIPTKSDLMKKSSKKQNIQSNKQKQFTTFRHYITKQLVDISIYQKIDKLLTAQNNHKSSKSSSFTEIHSLLLEYLEYYIYDLVSLLYLLEVTDDYEKIYANLSKLNQKLRHFLVDKTAQRIETHYSQMIVLKIIKQLEDKVQIVKIKNPRATFESSRILESLNLKNVKFLSHKQVKKLEATALRKWKKAVKTLQLQAIKHQTQFLYQIDHFSQIYNIKSKQELNSVINNEDLLRKLISVVSNLRRVLKQTQNKIFILSEVNKLVQSKYFLNLVNMEESREILAEILLEQLNEEEIYEQRPEDDEKWSENIFVVCLKLEILKNLDYFTHEYTLSSLEVLIALFKKSRKLFFSDSLKLRITVNEFKDVKIQLQPFYLLLSIFSEQIAVQSVGQKYLQDIINQIYASIIQHSNFDEYQWMFDNQNKVNFRYATHKRILQKVVQKFSKEARSLNIFRKVSEKYRSLSQQHSQSFSDQQFYYHALQKIQLSIEVSQASNKDKMWNFLLIMGLGSHTGSKTNVE